MTDKIFYNWQEFDSDVRLIAQEIDFEPDRIVGIARGGLPGAVMLSHIFETPAYETIRANYYDGMERREEVTVGDVYIPPVETDVLIFDDVVDTGTTMQAVGDKIQEQTDGEVFTVSLHAKPHREFEPDHYRTETDEWVVYPWEANE